MGQLELYRGLCRGAICKWMLDLAHFRGKIGYVDQRRFFATRNTDHLPQRGGRLSFSISSKKKYHGYIILRYKKSAYSPALMAHLSVVYAGFVLPS